MVSRDRISDHYQHPTIGDLASCLRKLREAVEIWRLLDVGRAGVPLELLAGRRIQCPPLVRTGEHRAVLLTEHVRCDALCDRVRNLLLCRPDVLQVHGLAVRACPDRVVRQVHVDVPGKCVGDHEHRRCEVVCLHLRMDASLKVPVAGQHGGGHKIVVTYRVCDWLRQWPGVTDTCRAAIANRLEAQRVKIFVHTGSLKVAGYDS